MQEVLFPLLLYHGIFFLTDRRRSQFNMAMHILTSAECSDPPFAFACSKAKAKVGRDIKISSSLPGFPPVLVGGRLFLNYHQMRQIMLIYTFSEIE